MRGSAVQRRWRLTERTAEAEEEVEAEGAFSTVMARLLNSQAGRQGSSRGAYPPRAPLRRSEAADLGPRGVHSVNPDDPPNPPPPPTSIST